MTLDLTKIKGLVSEEEAAELARLAGLTTEAIVEIGSYTGKSTVCMASVTKATVYAVDLWDMRLPERTEREKAKKGRQAFSDPEVFATFLKRTHKHANITWIKGASTEIAKAWSRPIGLLFIDGAHDRASVTADYEAWSPHIIPGGFLAMHDVLSVKNGVTKLGAVHAVIEEVVKPSGLWTDWQLVDRMAVARRVA